MYYVMLLYVSRSHISLSIETVYHEVEGCVYVEKGLACAQGWCHSHCLSTLRWQLRPRDGHD